MSATLGSGYSFGGEVICNGLKGRTSFALLNDPARDGRGNDARSAKPNAVGLLDGQCGGRPLTDESAL